MKKIIIHDFGNHDFIHQLTSKLSEHQLETIHISPSSSKTPNSQSIYETYKNKKVEKINYVNLNKYNLFFRFFDEIKYSLKLIKKIKLHKPNIFVSTCTSPIINFIIMIVLKRNKIIFVNWVQDIYFLAYKKVKKRYNVINSLLFFTIKRIEKFTITNSDKIIFISRDFINFFDKKKIDGKYLVLYNWADSTKIQIEKNNIEIGKKNKKFILKYSGTIGIKHNPYLICDIASKLSNLNNFYLSINSEGLGADIIKEQINKSNIKNIKLSGYLSIKDFNKSLQSSNMFLVILDKEASRFSIPSKILNYICAGKPILAIMDKENLSAKIILENNLGYVFEDSELSKIEELLKNNDKIDFNKYKNNAVKYRNENFNIIKISNKFLNFIFND